MECHDKHGPCDTHSHSRENLADHRAANVQQMATPMVGVVLDHAEFEISVFNLRFEI